MTQVGQGPKEIAPGDPPRRSPWRLPPRIPQGIHPEGPTEDPPEYPNPKKREPNVSTLSEREALIQTGYSNGSVAMRGLKKGMVCHVIYWVAHV